jgi:hypothetical protein
MADAKRIFMKKVSKALNFNNIFKIYLILSFFLIIFIAFFIGYYYGSQVCHDIITNPIKYCANLSFNFILR